MSKLLFDRPPISIDPDLANAIGLAEAAFVQQIHYWVQVKRETPSRYKDSFVDGYFWVFNSVTEWLEQMPFLGSEKTFRRMVKKLIENGIIVTANFNKAKFDKTTWYRIDYDVISSLQVGANRCGQNDQTMRSKCPDDVVKMTRPIPETTSETTSEITFKTPIPPKGDSLSVKIPAVYSASYKIQGADYETQPDQPLPFLKWGRKKIYLPRRMTQKFVGWITQYPETGGSYLDAAKTWDAKARSGMLTEQTADECLSNILAKKQSDSGWTRGAVPHPKTYLNGKHWETGPVQNDFPKRGNSAPKSNLSLFDEIIEEQRREQELSHGV